jgi:UDP-GlcNAc3NAcA epimerase
MSGLSLSMVILTVVGARPQFIKARPVSTALAAAGLREVVLHTGQHYDDKMSGIFFRELGLRKPDIQLGVGSGSHAVQTGAMLVGIEAAILEHKPDWVLVFGDTNSTLAGALAASKLQVPVAHVEAGLRSFNPQMPEEVNRIVADSLSQALFAPTLTACQNLYREGSAQTRVYLVGDVMFDAVLLFREMAMRSSKVLDDLRLSAKSYVLATVHRAENTDCQDRLRKILEGLSLVAQQVAIVMPLHPRTRRVLSTLNIRLPPNLRLIEPVGFLDMQRLEIGAEVIATDSGGVQKESFWHGVPCVTFRDETEWVELVESGVNTLCPPTSADTIATAILEARTRRVPTLPLHGDGTAATQIVRHLSAHPTPRRAKSQ